MAAMTTSPSKHVLPTPPNAPLPRNPLPLSASQEQQVRDLYYKSVRTKCADEIRDFVICSKYRTITATWVCSPQQTAMKTCMIGFSTQAEQDAAREEWFATIDKRREEREAKERKRKKNEVFLREWWDRNPGGKAGKS